MIYEELRQEVANRASSPENMAILVNALLETGLDGDYLNLLIGYTNLKVRLHRIHWNETKQPEIVRVTESISQLRLKLHEMRDRLGLTYASRLRKRFF